MSFAAMIGRRRQLVVPTPPVEPEEPPPGPTSDFASMEPPGFTSILDHTWDTTDAPPGWNLSLWGSQIDSVLVTDTGPEHPTSWGIRQKAGSNTGQLMILDKVMPANTRSVHIAVAFKLSSNFVFHANGTKLLYPFLTGTGRPFEFSIAPTAGRNGGLFRFLYFSYYLDNPGFPAVLTNNVNDDPLAVGTRYLLQFCVQNNSVVGEATGRVRWWISTHNGTDWNPALLKGDHQNLRIVPDGYSLPGTWGLWEYNKYYGGSGDNPVTEQQTFEFNRLYHSVSNEGI